MRSVCMRSIRFIPIATARASEHERARASMSEFECEPN